MDSTVRVIFLGDAASAVRSVNALEGRMGTLGGTAARTGKILVGAFGIGLIGGIAKATSAAISFDRSMRNVNSIAGLSERGLKKLEKQVLALGKVTGQGPTVLANGLYDIVSSGFKASDAIKILHTSAIAATAGMTDTATASKGVVAVLNAYHLSADKAKNVSSLLFKEVQLGVNNFGELAQNLGDTVPLAAQLKIPFSDMAAGLALITLHGTSMAEASTQMSRVMTDLLKPSKALSAELHSLGYENGQAAIQAHGFVPLIKQLSDAAGGSATKTADWFKNIRSLRGMLNLTGPNLKTFNRFAQEMAKSFKHGGDDVKAFNEQSKSISVRWDKATSDLTASAIKLGTQMFPILITGIGYLSSFSGWLTKLSGEHSIKAKIEFAGSSAEQYANHVRQLLQGALLGQRATTPGPQHAPGQPVAGDLKFETGFIAKAQQAILNQGGWAVIGQKIGQAIGNAIDFSKVNLGKISDDLLAWVNGPGGSKFGEIGAAILLNIVSKLLDPSFWLKHWQLAIGIGLSVLPAGKFAKAGELLAEGGFKLFGATAGKLLLAGLERLPGVFGRFAPRLAESFGSMVEKAGITASGKLVEWAASAVNKILGGFGKLGILLKALLYTAIVQGVVNLAGDLYSAGINLGKSIASGVLSGLAGLPGKILSAINPIHGGNPNSGKTLPGGQANPRAAGHAQGGVIDRPMLSMIGEDAPRFAEFIIPTNPKYRTRAMGLLGQANAALGLPGFAAGGGPHGVARPNHKLRKPGAVSVKSAEGAVKGALTQLTAAQQRVTDLGRTYDQDAREQGTVDLPPLTLDVPDDPTQPNGSTHQVLNQPGIDARVSQLNQLVTEKNGILTALDTERQRIEDAIKDVKEAIDVLLKAIAELQKKAKASGETARREHAAATAATNSVHRKGGLQDQVAAERAVKKPNRAKINQLEAAIRQAGHDHDSHETAAKTAETDQGRYQKQATDDASKVHDLRGTLTGLLQNEHDLPFDIRDQQIDVEDLQQQIRQVQGTSVSPFTPSTSGGGSSSTGGGASPNDSILQALVQQLTDALGLQDAQTAVIQGLPSFSSGIAYVPNDMVAQLHAGESVRTADQTASYFRNSTGGAVINVTLSSGFDFHDEVSAVIDSNVPAIIGKIGRSADTLRRSNRTA